VRRALFAVCVAWALCVRASPTHYSAAAQSPRPTLRASNILDEVKRYKEQRPGLEAAALALYANSLVARRGFDYAFEVCEIFPREMLSSSGDLRATGAPHTFRHRLTRLGGRTHVVRFTGPCT
jgi:hypothetical protein